MLALLATPSFAQYFVHGQVYDAQTNKPLPGATVFVSNTTKGTSTDAEGNFRINGLNDIHYNLVVSFLGYEPVVFDIVPGSSINYQVRLKPTVKVLNEVVVKATRLSKAEWNAYLRDFKNNFIGYSDNAARCVLENEEALVFDKDKNVLLASCDTALVVRNDGLGYRIRIILQRYQFDSKNDLVIFEGQMAYEQQKAADEKQKKHWAENRLKAYYGSEMHFFRALYNRRLNEEGFYFSYPASPGFDSIFMTTSKALSWYPVEVRTLTNYDRIVDTTMVNGETVLMLDHPLAVAYVNEIESFIYQRKREIAVRRSVQKSYLVSKEPAVVFPDGRLYPVEGAEASGYWSWELMAEALPLDYDPADDLKLLGKKN